MKKSFTKKSVKNNMDRLVKCFPQLTTGWNMFRGAVDKIAENYDKLAYPYHPNWRYCIPLAPNYTLKDGSVVDIGIHIQDEWLLEKDFDLEHCISANFVTSNEGPDYYSGEIYPRSEMCKVALQVLKNLEIIDEAYIMNLIGQHNNFIEKFMRSDLTVWDLQKWVETQAVKEGA